MQFRAIRRMSARASVALMAATLTTMAGVLPAHAATQLYDSDETSGSTNIVAATGISTWYDYGDHYRVNGTSTGSACANETACRQGNYDHGSGTLETELTAEISGIEWSACSITTAPSCTVSKSEDTITASATTGANDGTARLDFEWNVGGNPSDASKIIHVARYTHDFGGGTYKSVSTYARAYV